MNVKRGQARGISLGMGFKHHPSYDSGEYTERNKGKYENYKWVGMHSMPVSEDEKGGPRTSGISTESGIEVKVTR